jgi:hypothetical protein|tara:strand:- start:89 stop:367 length:279 start_codon:yes stop_codon:yes gene_type:complete
MKRILLFTAFLLFGLYCGIAQKATLYDLQVDHFYSPSGIDCKAPTFSWKTASKEYDLNQTHHQIFVATDAIFSKTVLYGILAKALNLYKLYL